MVHFVCQPHKLHHLLHASGAQFLFPPRGPQYEIKVLSYCVVVEQFKILEHDAQFTPQWRNMFVLQFAQVVVKDAGLPLFHGHFAVKRFEQSALSATHFAHDVNKVASVNLKVNMG